MATLVWDKPGERLFEDGISKAVLYNSDGSGVVWNGITSVDEEIDIEVEPVYFDGRKFDDIVTLGDFHGTLRAFTYPEEFLFYEGLIEDQAGFYLSSQPLNKFGLSYQTIVGSDTDPDGLGYKIHLLYNLTAVPAATSYKSLSSNVEPIEFEWAITSIPEELKGFRPTAHAILDSRKINPYLMADIEAILYGQGHDALSIVDNHDGTWTATTDVDGVITMLDETTFEIASETAVYLDDDTYTITSDDKNAHLPSLQALSSFMRNWRRLVITDNHDGTWTASSPIPGVITMLDDTKFSIEADNAEYLDADTYTISSSDQDEGDIWLPPL